MVSVLLIKGFGLPDNQDWVFICLDCLEMDGRGKKVHLRKVSLKYLISTIEAQDCPSLQRNSKLHCTLLTPLDFRAHLFISLTVFAYTATKMCTVCQGYFIQQFSTLDWQSWPPKVTSAQHARRALTTSYILNV